MLRVRLTLYRSTLLKKMHINNIQIHHGYALCCHDICAKLPNITNNENFEHETWHKIQC